MTAATSAAVPAPFRKAAHKAAHAAAHTATPGQRRRLGLTLACATAALVLHMAPLTAQAKDFDPRSQGGFGKGETAQWSDQSFGGDAVVRIGDHEGQRTRRIGLGIGKSVIVDLPRDAKEVFVANPAVANAVVRSTRKIFLIGQEDGETSVFIFDADGHQLATLEVSVGRELGELRDTLRRSFPRARIDIQPAGDSIILTGSVASATQAQHAVDIAEAFVGRQGNDLGGRGAVINSLTIEEQDQVMLRVAVVEVARAVVKQFGIQTNVGWNTVTADDMTSLFPLNPGLDSTRGSYTANFGGSGFDVRATLQAFERAGVSRTLAEPTLVAVSGESASFMAGGEIPVLTPCPPGDPNCVPSVNFKPFGINLDFTPVVLGENRISLRVSTEVSELDFENSSTVLGTSVPGMKVRKSETSVELPSGGTMMTAGLISTRTGQTVAGMPGLMNLPILGALFRSRDYQRQETELMILVSPYIAKPMEQAEAARPDDGFIEAFDPQAVLMGRFNQMYGTTGGSQPARGTPGRFGFIAD
ncbi:MAG: type II and III secretion system protein family protein [Salinarimonas sp.]